MQNYKKKILYNETCDILCAVDTSFRLTDNAMENIESDAQERLHLVADMSVDRMIELG